MTTLSKIDIETTLSTNNSTVHMFAEEREAVVRSNGYSTELEYDNFVTPFALQLRYR